MSWLEITARISLFVASLIYLVSAILLFKYDSVITDVLEDAKTYQPGSNNSVFFYSISLLIATFAALGQSVVAYTEKTTCRIIGFLGITLALGIIIFVNVRSNLDGAEIGLERKLSGLQQQYDWGLTGFSIEASGDANDIWDKLQTDMECCGVNSPTDWSEFAPKNDPDRLPTSCCPIQGPVESGVKLSSTEYAHNQTCNSKTMKAYQTGCALLMKGAISSLSTVFILVISVKSVLLILFIIIWVLEVAKKAPVNGGGNLR